MQASSPVSPSSFACNNCIKAVQAAACIRAAGSVQLHFSLMPPLAAQQQALLTSQGLTLWPANNAFGGVGSLQLPAASPRSPIAGLGCFQAGAAQVALFLQEAKWLCKAKVSTCKALDKATTLKPKSCACRKPEEYSRRPPERDSYKGKQMYTRPAKEGRTPDTYFEKKHLWVSEVRQHCPRGGTPRWWLAVCLAPGPEAASSHLRGAPAVPWQSLKSWVSIANGQALSVA